MQRHVAGSIAPANFLEEAEAIDGMRVIDSQVAGDYWKPWSVRRFEKSELFRNASRCLRFMHTGLQYATG